MIKTLQQYKSGIDPVWCPGCGSYAVYNALLKALRELDLAPENIVTVSGIGCSGRFSHYVQGYSMHGTHGRAVPLALGVKAARPELTVFAVGGDGDGLGIGGGHIAHAARKNVDITYILMDNEIYGLTKGQTSPTTPYGARTKTSPYGVYEDPMAPMPIFLAYDVSFIARITSLQAKPLKEILMQAISHRGFSIVYTLSPCREFPLLDAKKFRDRLAPVPEDHPVTDKMAALRLAYTADPIYTGVFYQVDKPPLDERLREVTEKAGGDQIEDPKIALEALLHEYA